MPTITDLPEADALGGSDLLVVVQSDETRRGTAEQMADYVRETLSDLVLASVGVDTLAELRLLPVAGLAADATVLVEGYYAPGDGGGGRFLWSPTETGADNQGTRILPTGHTGPGRWMRIFSVGASASVLQFGAVGDGLTDDSAAIQAALNAERFVSFPAGRTFAISSTISIPSGRTLWGYGSRCLAVALADNALMFANQVPSGTPARDKDITVIGLEFDGNGLGKGGVTRSRTAGLVRFRRADNVIFKDCYIHDIGFIGVSFDACKTIKVSGCRFERIGWDGEVSTQSGPALFVATNIAGEYCEDGQIFDNTFLTNQWIAIHFSCLGGSVIGNTIDGCYEAGIWGQNRPEVSTLPLSRRVAIIGNTIRNVRRRDVSGQGMELNCDDMTVVGNVIDRCELGGMLCYHTRYSVVSNNVISNVAQLGVQRGAIEMLTGPQGACDGMIISDNYIYDDQSVGTTYYGILAFTPSGTPATKNSRIMITNNNLAGPFIGGALSLGSLYFDIATSMVRANLGAGDVSGVTVPGPFANDAAAAAAGVQVGQAYRLTSTNAVMVRAA